MGRKNEMGRAFQEAPNRITTINQFIFIGHIKIYLVCLIIGDNFLFIHRYWARVKMHRYANQIKRDFPHASTKWTQIYPSANEYVFLESFSRKFHSSRFYLFAHSVPWPAKN